MYLTMNRFRVIKGSAVAFAEVWRSRGSHLNTVPGFKSFNLMQGPEAEDSVLYASHPAWADEASFVAWTKSEAFRMAHKGAGSNKDMYMGPPELEIFETVQSVE